MSDPLGWAEAVVDRAQIAEQIEARLPSGGRTLRFRVGRTGELLHELHVPRTANNTLAPF